MRWLRQRIAEDRGLARFVALHALAQLALALWDLPGSHGWENDGIAPRDLLGGLAANLSPGQAHRYPLLHYLLVALLAAPVLLGGLLSARSWSRADLEASFLSVPVMTGVSLAAKVLAIAMGALSLLVLGRLGRRLFSARAGRLGVGFAALNLSIAYYGRTSNLDGPYLTWTLLALDRLLDVLERGARRDYRLLGLLAAAAVATKDQAYAAFVLVVPIYLGVLPWRRPELAAAGRAHWPRLAQTALVALAGYAALAGPLWNPTGFLARVALLAGPNNQDWQVYTRDLAGLRANLQDLFLAQSGFWWPWPLVATAWLGVAVAARRDGSGRAPRPLRLLPVCAGLSALVCFTLVVRRCEHRFLLPLGTVLALHGGVALDAAGTWLRARASAPARWAWPVGLALVALAGLRAPLALALTQWCDARRALERELSAFLDHHPGETVELYGPLVYLPRLPLDHAPRARALHAARARVLRVGPEPVRGRNPLLGATELQADYADMPARRPGLAVLTGGFVDRFFPATGAGRVPARVFQGVREDPATQAWLRAALAGRLPGYRRLGDGEPGFPAWARRLGLAPVRVQGSVGQPLHVLIRDDLSPGSAGVDRP